LIVSLEPRTDNIASYLVVVDITEFAFQFSLFSVTALAITKCEMYLIEITCRIRK